MDNFQKPFSENVSCLHEHPGEFYEQELKKYLTKIRLKSIFTRRAEVAELVDALGSGSSARTGVGVRLSSSAPLIFQGFSPVILG